MTSLFAGPGVPANAQTTTITIDQTDGYDAGTTVTVADNVTTITGGITSGSNVFHSFAQFDLAQGDIAQWVRGAPDAASVANVINRVNGGDVSEINGTLRIADMPDADFWFINPAGVVLGEGATLDVGNAAYVGTAHQLVFADGSSFSTVTPDGSTFSSASPVAFGFLGGQGDLAVSGATPTFVSPTTELTLAAANTSVDGAFGASALNLAALGDAAADFSLVDPNTPAGAGRITIGDQGLPAEIDASHFELVARDISIRAATLTTHASQEPMRGISAYAGNLSISDSQLSLENAGSLDSGSLVLDAESVSLAASTVETLTLADDDASEIVIRAGAISIVGTSISSTTRSSGDAGMIRVLGTAIGLSDGAFLASQAGIGSTGNAGDVFLDASQLVIDGSTVSSSTFGEGNGGTIGVLANNAMLGNRAIVAAQAVDGSGSGGSVIIDAASLSIDDSQVGASTFSAGDAGLVQISADDLLLSENAVLLSTAQAGSTGDGGDILIEAGSLTVDGGIMSTSTSGAGDGGTLNIRANDIALSNFAFLGSAVDFGSGAKGGEILIDAASLTVGGVSTISSATFGGGRAGNIGIRAGSFRLSEFSLVTSDTLAGAAGNAGEITIETDNFFSSGSDITSGTDGSGNAGRITVRPLGESGADGSSIMLTNLSSISTFTTGSGKAGTVDVSADSISLSGFAFLISESGFGPTGEAGSVLVDAGSLVIDGSVVSSATFGEGNAGLVDVKADNAVLSDLAFIGSTAEDGSSGNGGDVQVDADLLTVDGSGVSSATFGTGNGGSIRIGVRQLDLVGDAVISTDASVAPAGSISLALPPEGVVRLIETGDGMPVISTSSGTNTGGRITIAEPYLILSSGGSILALGEVSGANVRISSDFFIRAADRINLLSVNGDLVLDSQFNDLSAGTETPAIEFLDASDVLSGQCAGARSSGRTSRFTSRVSGPYASGVSSRSYITALPNRGDFALERISAPRNEPGYRGVLPCR